jgi:hypothetical protein
MPRQCRVCDAMIPASRPKAVVCHREECKAKNKTDKLSMAAFEEITPELREHFSYFFSLVRTPKTIVQRSCLRCARQFASNRTLSPEYRLCEVCQRFVSTQGSLASV